MASKENNKKKEHKKENHGTKKESISTDYPEALLDFIDSGKDTLKIVYSGKRLNPIFGLRDQGKKSRISLSRRLRMIKISYLNKIAFRLIAVLEGSEFKNRCYKAFGMKIGKDVYISPGVYVDPVMPEAIEIGDGTIIGERAAILAHEFTKDHLKIGRVKIGKRALIGAFSTVRCGIRIGDEATVGMNSLVNKDIREKMTVGGIPAKEIK